MSGWVFVNKKLEDRWYESSKMIKMQYLIYYTLGRSKLLGDNKALIGGCHLCGLTSNRNLSGEAVLKVVSTCYTYEWLTLKKTPAKLFLFCWKYLLIIHLHICYFLCWDKKESLYKSGRFHKQTNKRNCRWMLFLDAHHFKMVVKRPEEYKIRIYLSCCFGDCWALQQAELREERLWQANCPGKLQCAQWGRRQFSRCFLGWLPFLSNLCTKNRTAVI